MPQGPIQVAIAPRPSVILLTAQSATGTLKTVRGGTYNWSVWGTWGGATAQLQWTPNGGITWIDIDGLFLSSNGGWAGIPLGVGACRVTITGGSGISLTSRLDGV